MTSCNKLYKYIKQLGLTIINQEVKAVYNHAGAIIVDSVLQAGLNYRTIVYPRVMKIIDKYSSFPRVDEFVEVINIFGLEEIIAFNNERKIRLINEILQILLVDKVSTVLELKNWLSLQKNTKKLLNLNGIGFKTIDYLKKLVGTDALPIDRHLINFMKNAGIYVSGYSKIQDIYVELANKLGVNLISIDTTIWQYMSKNSAVTYSAL